MNMKYDIAIAVNMDWRFQWKDGNNVGNGDCNMRMQSCDENLLSWNC